MPLRVLVVPDKFKGTLSALEAARAIARGWKRARPEDQLKLLPMSDGGDGFGEVLGSVCRATPQETATVDAAHRPCRSRWWWVADRQVAIIESARVIGLAMLPAGRFHPFELDTWGLGAVLQAALRKGASQCLIGLGGSATNDGGFGLARAMGWRFRDSQGREITSWPQLARLAQIEPPTRPHRFTQLVAATDVRNRLLGPRGCSRIFGPQKGLQTPDFPLAEAALKRLALVARQVTGRNAAVLPGAGAAGGLGFGLMAFLDAQVQPGFDVFARLGRLDCHLRQSHLVITGEGALDVSTSMGKGPGEVARLCRKYRVPCMALAGSVANPARLRRLFADIHALTDLTSLPEAKQRAAFWLEQLAAQAARCAFTGALPFCRRSGK